MKKIELLCIYAKKIKKIKFVGLRTMKKKVEKHCLRIFIHFLCLNWFSSTFKLKFSGIKLFNKNSDSNVDFPTVNRPVFLARYMF